MRRFTIAVNGKSLYMTGSRPELIPANNFALWSPTRFEDAAQALRCLAAAWPMAGCKGGATVVIEAVEG